MASTPSDSSPVIESWDTYWQGAEARAAYTSGVSGHPLVLKFWNDYFEEVQSRGVDLKIVDIASGNGAVVEFAGIVYGDTLPDFTCIDVSPAAIQKLQERFPLVKTIVSDAAAMPLESAKFDIATSLFGVEYAGLEALSEVARLVAPGGEIALLLHHYDGSIDRQCAASLDAVRTMQAANFIGLCSTMFETGFAALKGGDRDAYSVAGKQFAPAIRAMEEIIATHGTDVADGTIVRLYRDVRQIHANMGRYELADVKAWLLTMENEMEAYAGRMAAMRDVAINEDEFDLERATLVDKGFSILRAEPLAGDAPKEPIAWALIARKD